MNKLKMSKLIILSISFLMCFTVLISSNSQACVAANSNPFTNHEFKKVSYYYNGKGDRTREYEFIYNDGYFLCDANQLNGDVAKMSVALATAAYNTNHVDSILDQMGFVVFDPDSRDMTYDYVAAMQFGKDDIDKVAYTIACKEIDGYMVYCVPIKGTSSNAEWYSDFNLGTGNMHEGFYKAAIEIADTLNQLIDSDGYDESKTIVLTTGHSRGAAVSNIVGGWLTKSSSIPSSQIFSYNFATPMVSLDADTSLKNIYNFNNPGDLITLLPLKNGDIRDTVRL